MHLQFIALYLASIINVLLGLVVFYRAYKRPYSWFFVSILLFVVIWAIGDAMILGAHSAHLLSVAERLFYVGPMVIPISIIFFGLTFPTRRLSTVWGSLSTIALLGAALPILVDPLLIIRSVTVSYPFNVPHPRSPGFLLYSLYFSVAFIAVYVALFFAYKNGRTRLAKVQLKYTLWGVIIASVPALFTNLSLPLLGHTELIWLGPLFTTAFVLAIGISIVQHKMFDIRLVIARFIGYVLALSVLGVVYGFVVFGFGGLILHLHFSVGSQIYLAVIASITALYFGRLKHIFDRITTRLFYQDAYDAQDLYDQLNRILVSTLSTTRLLQETVGLLAANFKSEFVVVGLKGDDPDSWKVAGVLPDQDLNDAVQVLRKLTVKYPHAVIATDYLEESDIHMREILEQNNVAVLVRLTPNIRSQEEGLGYIAFGRKKSGSPYNSQDLRVLDSIANELIIAIQNTLHFEEIQKFNQTLQKKIRQATGELQNTNKKLRELDNTKDDFISMASHQLRTPLTSVKGYLSMVLDGDVGSLNDNQQKLLGQAFRSSQQMVYLISDLLNLSRLNTGKFVIESTPVNLSEIVQAEVDQLAETANARGVTLAYSKPESFLELMLDETKIHQVIMNFIDNAIYYTPAGGTITASLQETPSAIEFTVKDTGIGVPKTVQHKLFSKFYRADNAQKARPDGTGLGLFMAKKVIVAQGGSIIFESEEGKGSTFGFRFSKAGHLASGATPAHT